MPIGGKAAAFIALPRPAKRSQKVPRRVGACSDVHANLQRQTDRDCGGLSQP